MVIEWRRKHRGVCMKARRKKRPAMYSVASAPGML
jgi:hypothetical protein